MKKFFNIFILILFILISIQCSAQNKNPKKKNKSTKITKVNISTHNIVQIELEEMTRGSRRMITISPNTTTIEKNRQKSENKTNLIIWNDLQKEISLLELSKINTLEAPTTKRFHDGAMASTIRIKTLKGEFETQSFDSGNPHNSLRKVYQILEKLFEN